MTTSKTGVAEKKTPAKTTSKTQKITVASKEQNTIPDLPSNPFVFEILDIVS